MSGRPSDTGGAGARATARPARRPACAPSAPAGIAGAGRPRRARWAAGGGPG